MPRGFETFYAAMHIDVEDGPTWSAYRAPANVEIEYWMDTGPHPEHPEHDSFWKSAAYNCLVSEEDIRELTRHRTDSVSVGYVRDGDTVSGVPFQRKAFKKGDRVRYVPTYSKHPSDKRVGTVVKDTNPKEDRTYVIYDGANNHESHTLTQCLELLEDA